MGEGKGILQPHHLLDGLATVIGTDDDRKLADDPFFDVLKSAQVSILSWICFDLFCFVLLLILLGF